MFDFIISYQKDTENTRANILNKKQDYTGKSILRSTTVFKETNKGFTYNHKLLATIVILEDTYLKQIIKEVYLTDKYI